MKTLIHSFAILLFILATSPAKAQIQKGTWLLGGNLSGNIQSNTNYTSYRINLTPQIAYFTGKNFALGISFPLELQTNKYDGPGLLVTEFNQSYYLAKTNQTNLSISPFIRQYFGKSKWMPFVQANLSYSSQTNKSYLQGNNQAFKNTFPKVGGGLGAGVNYVFSNKVALEAIVDYQRAYRGSFPEYRYDYSNLQIKVGLIVLLSQE